MTVEVIALSLVGTLIIGSLVWMLRGQKRERARRKSLRQGNDGGWYWVDYDGSERRSDTHPDKPGGDWYTEPSSSSGFDGFDSSDGGGGD